MHSPAMRLGHCLKTFRSGLRDYLFEGSFIVSMIFDSTKFYCVVVLYYIVIHIMQCGIVYSLFADITVTLTFVMYFFVSLEIFGSHFDSAILTNVEIDCCHRRVSTSTFRRTYKHTYAEHPLLHSYMYSIITLITFDYSVEFIYVFTNTERSNSNNVFAWNQRNSLKLEKHFVQLHQLNYIWRAEHY